MKAAGRFLFLLCLLVLMPLAARAAITCSSVATTGFTWYYVNGTTAAVQLSYTVTCNRSSTSDATTFAYGNNIDNGLHAAGSNRAQLGSALMSYDLYLGSCAGTLWANKNPTNIDGTITWLASQTGIATDTQTYWACINTAQTLTTSGWYADTVTMTVKGPGGVKVTGSIAINIFAPASCLITTGPGTIALSYTAFSPIDISASTPFSPTCSSGMPYTIDVSPTSGTLAGVNYTVAPSTMTSTGTGSAQTGMSITATAVAGQSGICTTASCTQSQTHTLTITY
jgi:spore coat protein U-like protein